MSKDQIRVAIPELRFPEFRQVEQWKECQLDKLGICLTGLTYKPDDVRDAGLLVLRSSNIKNGQISLDDSVFVREDITGAHLLQTDDILICVRNGSKSLIGKNALIPETIGNCTHGAFMTVFRAKSPKFVYQLFQTDAFQRQVENDLGATINSINTGNFLRYLFFVPNLAEQQKIADCLSSLDELLAAEAERLEALRAHKKGLMQVLFPAEGERVPKVRFKGFGGEWRTKRLGEIAEFLKGKGVSKADIVQDGEIPCIRYGQLYTDYGEVIDEIKSFTNAPVESLLLSKKNDVIIPSSGETAEDIATASCILLDDIALGGDLNVIRSNVNGVFLAYYLNNPKKEAISKLAQGISVVHLYNEQLKSLEVLIPIDNEQQKIAACLSSVDELIAEQEARLEGLRAHKKGLMQGLFVAN